MKQSVVTAFKETIFCKLDELKEMQGKLKSLEKSEYEKFKKQMIENGFTDPFNIWIDDKGKKHILDGHTRKFVLLGLREEGIEIPELFPCNVIEAKSRKEAIKKLLGMVSQYGKASMESLSDFAINEGIDFSWLQENTDIPNVDLDELEVESDPELDAKADEVPEVEQNIHNVKLGQIWKLGEHRLMCGDSTDEAVISALMNGEKADMVFTDPPYNLQEHCQTKRTNKTKSKREDFGDWDVGFDPLAVLPLIDHFTKDDSHRFVCTSNYLFGAIHDWFVNIGDKTNYIVWVKDNPMPSLSKSTYVQATELVVHSRKGKTDFKYPSGSNLPNVVRGKVEPHTSGHPSQKPIYFIDYFLNPTKGTVLDLFGGSGSTLIACEKTNRKCFMMELDPHYCSVIIERWQQFTGKKAELLNG